ncbi:MAG: hypothetical protein SFY92_09170 [Verrucomicrobiae bacterium]|nr:hypothetical protein [Verrucomicrobiae bacterium]
METVVSAIPPTLFLAIIGIGWHTHLSNMNTHDPVYDLFFGQAVFTATQNAIQYGPPSNWTDSVFAAIPVSRTTPERDVTWE